jgi:hypothetical protein
MKISYLLVDIPGSTDGDNIHSMATILNVVENHRVVLVANKFIYFEKTELNKVQEL